MAGSQQPASRIPAWRDLPVSRFGGIRAGEVGAAAAGFYGEMGCQIIAIVDPVSSQIMKMGSALDI